MKAGALLLRTEIAANRGADSHRAPDGARRPGVCSRGLWGQVSTAMEHRVGSEPAQYPCALETQHERIGRNGIGLSLPIHASRESDSEGASYGPRTCSPSSCAARAFKSAFEAARTLKLAAAQQAGASLLRQLAALKGRHRLHGNRGPARGPCSPPPCASVFQCNAGRRHRPPQRANSRNRDPVRLPRSPAPRPRLGRQHLPTRRRRHQPPPHRRRRPVPSSRRRRRRLCALPRRAEADGGARRAAADAHAQGPSQSESI